jgi:hypothetical protein
MPEVIANDDSGNVPKKNKLRIWLKRIGVAGFLFFLIKGLVWLFFGGAILSYFAC